MEKGQKNKSKCIGYFVSMPKQWREQNRENKGNIRDYATIEQLVVLSNMESTLAMLIHQNMEQPERLLQLNQMAITQMNSLVDHQKSIKNLK